MDDRHHDSNEKLSQASEKTEMYDQQEELTEEEFIELVLQEQEKSMRQPKAAKKKMPRSAKGLMMIMSFVLLFSSFSVLFEVLSIPAIQFLKTSASLSKDEAMVPLKEAVVVISTESGKGTGFSITADGQIVTNYHVIEQQKMIKVLFPEHGTFTARITEAYPDIDLAVLTIQGENLPHVQLAEHLPDTPELPVRFIGNPLSFHLIINEGHLLSSITLHDWDLPVMMMKAPVYRGNSGSPVFNDQRDVIGVVFATLQTETDGNVGLLVPIDYLHEKRLNKQ